MISARALLRPVASVIVFANVSTEPAKALQRSPTIGDAFASVCDTNAPN